MNDEYSFSDYKLDIKIANTNKYPEPISFKMSIPISKSDIFGEPNLERRISRLEYIWKLPKGSKLPRGTKQITNTNRNKIRFEMYDTQERSVTEAVTELEKIENNIIFSQLSV